MHANSKLHHNNSLQNACLTSPAVSHANVNVNVAHACMIDTCMIWADWPSHWELCVSVLKHWSSHKILFVFPPVFLCTCTYTSHPTTPHHPCTSFWTRRCCYSYRTTWIPIRWTPAAGERVQGLIPIPASPVGLLALLCSCVWTWCFSALGRGEMAVAMSGSNSRASSSHST